MSEKDVTSTEASNDSNDSSNDKPSVLKDANISDTSNSPIILRESKFSNFSTGRFAMRPSVFSSSTESNGQNNASVLRPSKLGSSNSNTLFNKSSTFNPFKKTLSDDDIEERDEQKPSSSKNSEVTNGSNGSLKPGEPLVFVPLTNQQGTSSSVFNNSTNSNVTSFSSNIPSFVFGRNLHERVEGAETNNQVNGTSSSSTSLFAETNGSAEPLFNAACAVSNLSNGESNHEKKSLTEAAREYEESRSQKRKYDEVQIVTGEEDEYNIIQINCKMFAFDQATKNWQELGRGTLRLNDYEMETESKRKYTKSRLVVRATGNLRVVLNTKIWAGMIVELASEKSIRLTAMDNAGVVKVFLLTANKKEVEKLHTLLKNRVAAEIARQEQKRKEETIEQEKFSEESNSEEIEEPVNKKLATESEIKDS